MTVAYRTTARHEPLLAPLPQAAARFYLEHKLIVFNEYIWRQNPISGQYEWSGKWSRYTSINLDGKYRSSDTTGLIQRRGLFVVRDNAPLRGGIECYLNRPLPAQVWQWFRDNLGATDRTATLKQQLFQMFTINADPSGNDRPSSLIPKASNNYEIVLGGIRLKEKIQLSQNPRLIQRLRSDIQSAGSRKRKLLDYWRHKFRIPIERWQELRDILLPGDTEPRDPHSTEFTDSFTYSDGDLGTVSSGVWADAFVGNLQVANNAIDAGVIGASRHTGSPSGDDIFQKIQVNKVGSEFGIMYLYTRLQGNIGDCYRFSSQTQLRQIQVMVGYGPTTLATVSDPNEGATSYDYVSSEGSTHTLTYYDSDGTTELATGSTTDATYSSYSAGWWIAIQESSGGVGDTLDDWSGGDIPLAPTTSTTKSSRFINQSFVSPHIGAQSFVSPDMLSQTFASALMLNQSFIFEDG